MDLSQTSVHIFIKKDYLHIVHTQIPPLDVRIKLDNLKDLHIVTVAAIIARTWCIAINPKLLKGTTPIGLSKEIKDILVSKVLKYKEV